MSLPLPLFDEPPPPPVRAVPPYLDVVHETTGERRTLAVVQPTKGEAWHGLVKLRWTGGGGQYFWDERTGWGAEPAVAAWRITPEMAIHFGGTAFAERPRAVLKRRKAKVPKLSSAQRRTLRLFDE